MVFKKKLFLIIASLLLCFPIKSLANCENKRSGYDPSYVRQVVCKFDDGSTYEGGMNRKGKQTGFGTYTFPGGDVYSGNFHFGQPNGEGIYEWANGTTHSGAFSNGKPHGQGTRIESGEVREGTWKSGVREGHFKITVKKYQTIARGIYKNDEREGDWIVEEADGSKIHIKYRNGVKISSITDKELRAKEAKELKRKKALENEQKELAKKKRELAKKQQLEKQKRYEAALKRDQERREKFAAEQERKKRVVDQCLLKLYEDGIPESELEYLCEKMVDKSALFKNCLIQKGRGKPEKIISAAVTACEAIEKNPSALEKVWYQSGIGSLF